MSYDLLLLGAPRTATRSLWTTLGNHENICNSDVKEIFNMDSFWKYMEFFQTTSNTKVLVDGTPSPYKHHEYRLRVMLGIFKEISSIKILYPLRKPHDRLYSTIKQTAVSKSLGRGQWTNFITDEIRLNLVGLFDFIQYNFFDSDMIFKAKSFSKNILFFRFDELESIVDKILDFLNLEWQQLDICVENTFSMMFDMSRFKVLKSDMDDLFRIGSEGRIILNKIFVEDLNKVQKMTGLNLKDWIEEIQDEGIQ